METESSSPYSQDTSTSPYPEPHKSSPATYFFEIHFNIIVPSCQSLPSRLLVCSAIYILKDGGSRFFRNFDNIYQTTRHHIPEDSNLHSQPSNIKTKYVRNFKAILTQCLRER
jgi:hypothetical protein